MSYELKYSDNGFVVRFRGMVTIEELNKANGEIQGHFNFDDHNYQIVDLLDADLSSVTEEDAEFPAETDSIASQTRRNVKVALIAREKHALNIVMSYVQYARALIPNWQFDIFSTREDALNWTRTQREGLLS